MASTAGTTEEAGLVTTPEDETDAQRTPSSIKLCAVGYRCRPSSSKEAQEADVFRGGSLEEESLIMPLRRIIALMILASFDNQLARRHFWSVLLFNLSFKNRVRNTRFYLEKTTCALLAPCDIQTLTP